PVPLTVIPPAGLAALPAVSDRPTPANATTAATAATSTSMRSGFMTSKRRRAPHRHNRGMRYQFVDCRWELGTPGRGRELYLEGHLPGASFLDVDEDLAAPPGERGRHPLPDPEDFASAASRAWIRDGVFVVAYGNMGGPERLWWLLRHFGHDDCAVLDVDAWHGPLRAGEAEIEPGEFEPLPREGDTMEADELARRLDELVIVDARLPGRFRGE